ncbi:MAG: enoyl-CoA hydratase-related protein [Chloroflexota bacterium]
MSGDGRLAVRAEGAVLRVGLQRPEVHNALDGPLVEDLRACFASLPGLAAAREDGIRALVLSGAGRSFCAGADLGHMQAISAYGAEENRRDALALAEMLQALDSCPVPTVARVQGAALGGGIGLLACCDVVVAAAETRFGFSEARLGLLPAVISPYVVAKIGRGHARALFATAERFDAARALRIGLVHHVVPAAELDSVVGRIVADLLAGAPGATSAARGLIDAVAGRPPREVAGYTADLLAGLRASEEGHEGLTAFLEKRSPRWALPPEGPV